MAQQTILLPSYHSRLIGRATETSTISDLLRDSAVRLVTILGDSGTGKTRLALESAALMADNFPDGVFFVALAPVDNTCFVLSTIAATLDIKEQKDETLLNTLQRVLQTKRMLLILDNVEQVSGARNEIGSLLAETSNLTLLLTSQVPLNVEQEIIFDLPPLLVPSTNSLTPEEALAYPAVALFTDRMQGVQHRFRLTSHNLTPVLEICRCLQGFPLAIELVAAHSSSLHPQDLLVLLRNHLAMHPYRRKNKLSSRDEILDPVLTWCYSQLPAVIQTVFRRAGIFHGGCTVETMHAICADVTLAHDSIETALHVLSSKQLLQKEILPGKETRYIMLDAMRAYAETLLKRRYEWRQVSQAHSVFYLKFVKATATNLESAAQPLWLKRLDSEIHNLRAALKWFEESQNWSGMAMLACDLDRYWLMRGLNSEVQLWARTVLAHASELPPSLLAKTYKLAGMAATRQGNFEHAYDSLQNSLDLYDRIGDRLEQARILIHLGATSIQQGQFLQALNYLNQALRHESRIADDPTLMLNLLNNRGTAELQLARYSSAVQTFNQVVAICRATNNLTRLSSALVNSSVIDCYLGDYAMARARCEEVLEIQESLGNELHRAASLANLSTVLIEEGEYEEAKHTATRALELCTRLNEQVGAGELYTLLARIARHEGQLDAAFYYSEQSVTILQAINEKRYLATGLHEVALVALESGDWRRSLELLRESFQLLMANHVVAECSANLEALAGVVLEMGNSALAACLEGAAAANRLRLGTPLPPSHRHRFEDSVVRAKSLLGSDAFDAHWNLGCQMSLGDALRLIIDQTREYQSPIGTRTYTRPMMIQA